MQKGVYVIQTWKECVLFDFHQSIQYVCQQMCAIDRYKRSSQLNVVEAF